MSMQKRIFHSAISAFWVALVAGFLGVKMVIIGCLFAATFVCAMAYLGTPSKV